MFPLGVAEWLALHGSDAWADKYMIGCLSVQDQIRRSAHSPDQDNFIFRAMRPPAFYPALHGSLARVSFPRQVWG